MVANPLCCRSNSGQRMQFGQLKKRDFITLLGGAAAWPLVARAQQGERMRRIGVLAAGTAANDRDLQTRMAAFAQSLQQLGWTDGRNMRIEYRWSAGNDAHTRKHAAELVALAPDVILAGGTATMAPLLQATRTVPIVFASVADPVGAGFIDTLARPGGNTTGFMAFEYGLSGKWLELLKQIAPNVTRAAVLRDPNITAGIGQFAIIQSAAQSVGVEVSSVNLRDAGEIERDVLDLRALSEWRPDRDVERVSSGSSRADNRAGGAVQIAHGLLPTRVRHRWRPDLLWA
jgi:putative tryptophan/tyrosine transport system substrate-binding protein